MKNAIRLATFLLALAATSFAGVNVSSPAEGAVTNSPLHVVASASPFNGKAITVGQVYIDGKLSFQQNGSSFDTYINVAYGKHEVAVKFWDAGGANSMAVRHTIGSGSGVTISSPSANSVSTNGWVQVKATAFSPNNVVALKVYDNGNLIKQVNSGSIDVGLQLNGAGSHYMAVQAWDSNGTTFLSPVVVNVGTAQPQPQAGGGTPWGPQGGIPSGATATSASAQMEGWPACEAGAAMASATFSKTAENIRWCSPRANHPCPHHAATIAGQRCAPAPVRRSDHAKSPRPARSPYPVGQA